MVNKPNVFCICGNTSQSIPMLLRPTTIGLLNVKVVAKYPNDLSSDQISDNCNQSSKTISFLPQNAVKTTDSQSNGYYFETNETTDYL